MKMAEWYEEDYEECVNANEDNERTLQVSICLYSDI